ncbi:recombinase family protein [Saccharibacillus sp. WB 17]|uniref:recombinase family protein n=1 Tax=Saccharibacillus sp. WB 17 TaxID=2603535 RepID=UPI00123AC2D5
MLDFVSIILYFSFTMLVLFFLMLYDLFTMWSIICTNELNQEGHRAKRKKPFSMTAIKNIVTNPMFVVKIRYNRYEN